MIQGKKAPFVLEDHDLILCISSLGIFPVVNCYFAGSGAVVAGNVKYATSWDGGPFTWPMFTNTTCVFNIGI
jgi:hypothetical protein